MLGPIGSEIMSIFRLLSPDEIDKYIVEEKADGYRTGETSAIAANGHGMALSPEHSGSMSDFTDSGSFPKDHQAKIIPLKKEDSKREAPPKDLHNHHPSGGQERGDEQLESVGILSSGKIKQIEAERLREENSKKESATVFLLKERERMRAAKKKLIEQVAIKSYQTNSSQEFYDEVEDDSDEGEESSNDLKGILLNKRHY